MWCHIVFSCNIRHMINIFCALHGTGIQGSWTEVYSFVSPPKHDHALQPALWTGRGKRRGWWFWHSLHQCISYRRLFTSLIITIYLYRFITQFDFNRTRVMSCPCATKTVHDAWWETICGGNGQFNGISPLTNQQLRGWQTRFDPTTLSLVV